MNLRDDDDVRVRVFMGVALTVIVIQRFFQEEDFSQEVPDSGERRVQSPALTGERRKDER